MTDVPACPISRRERVVARCADADLKIEPHLRDLEYSLTPSVNAPAIERPANVRPLAIPLGILNDAGIRLTSIALIEGAGWTDMLAHWALLSEESRRYVLAVAKAKAEEARQ